MTTPQNETPAERPTAGLLARIVGSGLFTGYAPFATGTVGSAVAAAFFLLPDFQNPFILIPATAALFVAGGIAAGRLEAEHGQDPAVVTVDEFVGMWISLWFIEPTVMNIGLAFVIFRVLDILKPYPAGVYDRRSGGWNIMLDDVIAGIYSNIILQIALRWT